MVDQNSQFYAILTNVGAAKQANADAMGIPWKITQMGVGDANGTDPTPNATQTALLNEWRRAPLNQLKVDDKDSAIIVAEQVIPAEVGGHWIREIGLYDADGDLVAVANCAPTYKPLLNQGSGRTQVVRMSLVVSSSSNVQLKIDPSVVLATREFVTEELARQDFKHTVLVATTAPIVLSGLQTVDGVALQAGQRVLVKDQAAGKDNGLYQVAAGAWVRSADADSSAKVTPGLLVLVERGSINGDSAWQLVTDAPISLGVTGLAFEMAFGRTGVAAGTYRSVTVDKYGRVVAATNPTTVAGYGLTDVYTKTEMNVALAAKAPLESPTFSGLVQVPTAVKGNSSLQAANTAFVQSEITSLINGSPGALDTLKELADALGNDPNFATTVLNGLGGKADKATTLAGYGITDDVQIRGQKVVGAFTVECLDATDNGTTSGILIRTKIPAADGIMPLLTIKGALSGYTAPFEAQLCWYFYENAFYQPQVIVKGTTMDLESLFNVHLSASGGLVNIRLDFGVSAYLPRLTVTAIKDRVYGGSLALYQGWTSTPYAAAISGEVKAYRVATLTTANIHIAASNLAKTGMLPVGNVTGLPEALVGKAPTVHAHALADITGLDAALRAASGLAQGTLDQDPNLAVNQVILTNHPNVPIPGFYWHITTTFFNFVASNANRSQIAVQYDGGCAVFVRSIYNTMGGWTKWRRLDSQVSAGTIVYWPGYTPPPGYLKANGAQVSRTTYAELFAAISTFGGVGDGSTTFNVPDLRGEFIRCYDDGRGVDINRALGSVQFSQNLSHIHTGYAASGGVHSHNVNMGGNDVAGYRPAITAPGADGVMIAGALSWEGAHTHELVINAEGGNESRPRNMALLACIKY